MIVYIKSPSGKIYASPVFAEIGRGWNVKSVVLNEKNDGLILLPYLGKKNNFDEFNYFYIDETLQDGWIKKKTISGFAEIIENKSAIKELKRNKTISIEQFQCGKLYDLPLQVVTDFTIKTEQDIEIFNTVCWGLHDALIKKIDKTKDDVTIYFDTTWGKHILITFHGVKEVKNIEHINCIFDSEFEVNDKCTIWRVSDVIGYSDSGSAENPYIIAQLVTWKLIIV